MSRIGDLGPDLINLPNVIAEYEDALQQARTILPIENKMLEFAHKEQCAWIGYFDERRAEIKTLVKYLAANVAKVRGQLVRRYTERSARALGERVMNSYIDSEPEYLAAHELLLEVEELYEKYTAVVEAFNKRGFALRDITSARVADVHHNPI